MSSHPAQNGSNIADAGQSRIPVKAMAGVTPTYPAKAALARPVTVMLSRLAVAPSRLRIPRRQMEDSMTITTFIILLNAIAQLLGNLANLTVALMRYAELRRWRRQTLRGLKRRREC